MAYMDNSGLYVKIGTEVAVPQAAGEYNNLGALREIEINIPDLTKVLTTDAIIIGADNLTFPKGVVIESAQVYCTTTATGATATLNIGLVQQDRVTVIDTAAILSAFPLASLVAGQETTVVKGGTGAGTLIGNGAATTLPAYLSYKWVTAAFTAGAVRIRVRYFRP